VFIRKHVCLECFALSDVYYGNGFDIRDALSVHLYIHTKQTAVAFDKLKVLPSKCKNDCVSE